MAFYVKKTVCNGNELEVRYRNDRAGFVVIESTHSIVKCGDRILKINDLHLNEQTIDKVSSMLKTSSFIDYTTAELDPNNPQRDLEIYLPCRRIFTLMKKEQKSFGFSVTTKHRKNETTFDHVIGKVVESGPADIAGLRNQMKILSVNGETVKHINHGDIVKLISTAGDFILIGIREVTYKTIHNFTGKVVFCKML